MNSIHNTTVLNVLMYLQWYKEIEQSAPGVPIVLVGTKSDLRNVKSAVEQLKKNGEAPITKQQGEEMAQEIGAYKYFECSAKTQDGLSLVFEECVRYVLFKRKGLIVLCVIYMK